MKIRDTDNIILLEMWHFYAMVCGMIYIAKETII